MDIQLINDGLLAELHEKARGGERLRQNFDLRTSPEDGSQRMLNVLEVGTHIPIHRHLKSSETVVCLEGCFDEIFFEELPNKELRVLSEESEQVRAEGLEFRDSGELKEQASPDMKFKEVARFRVCPREGTYGIQVPKRAWHTLEVHEASTIFEAKDGAYGK